MQLRDKSILNPSAQSTKLCATSKEEELNTRAVQVITDGANLLGNDMRFLIDVMQVSGCRVSEILNVTWRDIGYDASVYIAGLKGSESKIVKVSYTRDIAIAFRKNKINPFAGVSRFYVYRLFKKLNLILTTEKGDKNKVTHSFRHCNARIQELSGFNLADTQKYLGQRSINSTKHYRNGN